MTIEIDQVYTLKISNGDELIAKIIADEFDQYVLSSPMTVLPSSQGIQLVPSLFTAESDAKIKVNKSNVSMMADTRAEVRDSYIEATTGIKPVRNKLLMG
jgi:hypothetical protein